MIVAPIRLDRFEVELIAVDPGPVDDPVDEAASEPRRQRPGVSKLVSSSPCADDGLLGTVLGLVSVTDEPGRKPDQSR
jgi:hypothetical protein